MARVTLAEDQAHLRRVLAHWFRCNGHAVVEAGDGLAATEAPLWDPFGVVV